MNKQRFFIDTEGNDDEAYREAIQFAIGFAKKDSKITRIILLVQSKRHTNWLNRLHNDKIVKALFSGMKLPDCDTTIKIETIRTYRKGHNQSDIVITFALPINEVYKLDDYDLVKVIIAIPWLKNGVARWVIDWNSIELRNKQ
jgi:hypothetical protein